MLAHLQQFLDDPNGPLPTYFEVEVPYGVEKVGDVAECDPIVEYDPNFMLDLKFFEENVYWRQTVDLQGAFADAKISGYVYFMVCDASMCLPPEEVPFEVGVGDVRDAGDRPNYCAPSEHWCNHEAHKEGDDMFSEGGSESPSVEEVQEEDEEEE